MENLTTYQKQVIQFNKVIEAINTGVLKQCDGLMVKEPTIPIIKHYLTFAYQDEYGTNWFFITMASIGFVKLMDEDELFELALKYDFTLEEHIPFEGSELEREQAFERGMAALGKSYKWVGANCENLMNYIQTGVSKSNQVRNTATGAGLVGALMATSKNKNTQYVGYGLLAVGVVGWIVDLFSDFE